MSVWFWKCIWNGLLLEWRSRIYAHDDVIKWKHFPRYWPFVRGIHRSPVNSPHKSQWRGALMFSLICARINGWVNTRKGGDLRRHRAHYDVNVMGTRDLQMAGHLTTLRPRGNGRHFAGDIFESSFLCMKICLFLFKFHKSFFPKISIRKYSADSGNGLVWQIVTWINEGLYNLLVQMCDDLSKVGLSYHCSHSGDNVFFCKFSSKLLLVSDYISNNVFLIKLLKYDAPGIRHWKHSVNAIWDFNKIPLTYRSVKYAGRRGVRVGLVVVCVCVCVCRHISDVVKPIIICNDLNMLLV